MLKGGGGLFPAAAAVLQFTAMTASNDHVRQNDRPLAAPDGLSGGLFLQSSNHGFLRVRSLVSPLRSGNVPRMCCSPPAVRLTPESRWPQALMSSTEWLVFPLRYYIHVLCCVEQSCACSRSVLFTYCLVKGHVVEKRSCLEVVVQAIQFLPTQFSTC